MEAAQKAFAITAVWAFALVPVWFFFLVKYVLDPHGFWQNIFLLGLGVYVLWTIQGILALLGLFFTFVILSA